MKKLFALILIVLMLTSCVSNGATGKGIDPDVYWVDSYTARAEGMYFLKDLKASNTLCYVDFSNMAEGVVCPKPNCTHDDRETCYALGVTNGAGAILQHGKKIYWLYDDGDGTRIYRANRDGTGREAVRRIEGVSGDPYVLCVVGNKMYFTADDQRVLELDEFGNIKDNPDPLASYLYSYDFDTGEATEVCNFLDIFPDAEYFLDNIYGVWNGGIYLHIIPAYLLSNGYDYTWVDYYYRYDISEGTLEKCDFVPWNISGGYMIFLEGSTVRLIHESGKEYEFKNSGASQILGAFVVNGKLFIKDKVIDIETGKQYKRLTDLVPITYTDGQYILLENREMNFKKLPENKVIGDEIT